MGFFDFIKKGLGMGDPVFDDLFGDSEKSKKKTIDLYGMQDLLPELKDLASGVSLGKRGRPLRDLLSEVSLTTQVNQALQPRLSDMERAKGEALARLYSEIYGPLAREEGAKDLSFSRESDVSDVARLGPELLAARRASDPLFAKYRDTIESDLAAGSSLTPEMEAELEHYVRGGQAARGFGLGPADIYQEALAKTTFGQQLKQQRLGNAAGALSLYGDPGQFITGRTTGAGAFAANAYNQGAASQDTNPYNPYTADVGNTNLAAYWDQFNNRQNRALTERGQNMALVGSVIEGAGSLGAAGIVACWVAREVFGPDNPQWLDFREWLLTRAPERLRELYLKHGPALAARLREQPELKPRIREFMEAKIASLASPSPVGEGWGDGGLQITNASQPA
jgi:hypothetical protein